MIIAIDGPAGSGKSTVASIVAKRLGITYLNSGSFYRALTLALLDAGVINEDECAKKDGKMPPESEVLAFVKSQNIDYHEGHLYLNNRDVESVLHADRVSKCVSRVSAITALRHFINDKMKEITKNDLSIISEGRDMTTVVFPNADHKFYLDASLDVQAERRFKEGVSNLSLEEIKESIRLRDEMDKNKAEGSLRISPDSTYIDTTHLTIDEVCEIIISKCRA